MTDVLFYHLEAQPLDAVLPKLLQRSLDRGWRAAVQATSPERVAALDTALWIFDEASFLPHGVKADGQGARHPVLLTDDDTNLNDASVRFFVDRAEVAPALKGHAYERAVVLFDGADDEAVADARRQWSGLKGLGYPLTYWQQGEDGRWEKRA